MNRSGTGLQASAVNSLRRALTAGWQGIRAGGVFPPLIVLVAALGMAHILVRTYTYGAALGNDQFNYLSAAESLVAGEGLLSPGGGQMTLFAPFFSVAMAFLSLFGLEPVDGGRFLNAAAFGLLILVAGLWMSRRLESQPVALAVAVAVMAALPLSHSASTLLSEPLFILFIVLALMPLESFLGRRSGKRALLLSAVFAALAAVTRYMGVALILSAVLMLLLRRSVPVRQRLKDTLVFGAISSLPLAALMLRNQLVAGDPVGDRSPASGQPLFDSLYQIVVVFEGWANPLLSQPQWQLQAPSLLIAGLVLLLAALLLAPRPGKASSVFWAFSLAYLAVIAMATPLASWQGIDSRYMLPVYVPLLFVAGFWLDGLLRHKTSGSKASGRLAMARWGLVALALIGGSLHIGFSVQQNLRVTAEALESGYIGVSLNTAYWEDSELVEYVRANPVSGRYYVNDPNVLRWNAGVTGTRVTWVPTPRQDLGTVYDCQAWFERAILQSREYGEPEKHVVWVGQGDGRRIMCTILHMQSPLPLEPVAELADGAIFRVNPAFDSARARRSAWEAIISDIPDGPAIRSDFDFDVHLSENTLTYLKEPCSSADDEARFFLHLYPVDVRDLPNPRQRHGFDNLDFDFDGRSVMFDGRCLARVALPDYDIARIRTGQFVRADGGFNTIWEEEIPFSAVE